MDRAGLTVLSPPTLVRGPRRVLSRGLLKKLVARDGYGSAAGGGVPDRTGFSASAAPDHILVIDCGSTGTRLNIIRRGEDGVTLQAVSWEEYRVPFPGYTPKKHGYNRLETTPGIHNQAGAGDEGVRSALDPLLLWAKEALAGHGDPAHTPILLFATAGARKLGEADRNELMASVRRVLSSSGFRFRPEWAKIIAGEDEGIFSWVSSNYKLGKFAAGDGGVVNMLELGGSSLQASYVVNGSDAGAREVEVLGRKHGLKVQSFNGYGMNDAFNATLYHLLGDTAGGLEGVEDRRVVAHPCLQRGYAFEPKEIGVRFEGAFDSEACSLAVLGAFSASELSEKGVARHHAGVGGTGGGYIALAGFYLVYSFFGLDLGLPLSEAARRTGEVCSGAFDETLTAEEREDRNAGLYCFRSVYSRVILNEWLGLGDDQVAVYGSSEWALGAALLTQWEDDEAGGGRREAAAAGMAPLGAGALVLVGLGVWGWRRRRRDDPKRWDLPIFSRDKHP